MFADWLKSALKTTGLSQAELAARLTATLGRSIDRSAVNKMALGKREMAADELLAIAKITNLSPPGLSESVRPIELPFVGLPIIGSIQAGAWLDTAMIDPSSEPEMLQVLPDKRFPRARQYVLLVVGNSMDIEYPDGSYVTCVDYADSGLSPREGMIVHIERHEAGGQRVEITLKQLHQSAGHWQLVPRSSDPKWKPIQLNGSHGESDVIIRGVVTGGWRRTEL